MKKRFKKIYIEITNICNLNCSFCPKTVRNKEMMKIEQFEYILNQIKWYTDLICLHVKGEPLMHDGLKDILDLCDKYNLMVNITTNGTLLKSNIDILSKSKALRQINISLHSQIVNNELALKIEDYMKDVLLSVRKLKDKIISYRLWNNKSIKGNDENIYILECLEKEYGIANLYDKLAESKWIKLKDKVYVNQDIEFKWPDIKEKEISQSGTCLGLKNQVAILVNGDVVPCCLDENACIKLGNIYENTFENIINSDRSKNIIDGFNNNKLVEKLCKTCGFRKRFDNEDN